MIKQMKRISSNLPLVSSFLKTATEPNKELVKDAATGPFLITSTSAFGGSFLLMVEHEIDISLLLY